MNELKAIGSQPLVSEDAQLYRAEYLAFQIFPESSEFDYLKAEIRENVAKLVD